MLAVWKKGLVCSARATSTAGLLTYTRKATSLCFLTGKRLILKIRINNWCTVRLCDQVLQSVQSESIDCPGTSTARPVLLHTQDDCSISKSMPASMLGPQLLSSLTMVVQHQQKQEETRKHGTPARNDKHEPKLPNCTSNATRFFSKEPALLVSHCTVATM